MQTERHEPDTELNTEAASASASEPAADGETEPELIHADDQPESEPKPESDYGSGLAADATPVPAPAEPGTLPDFLDRVAARLQVHLIEDLWIFPPRKSGFGESTVLALSAFEEDRARRRILTARFSVTRDPKGNPIIEEAIDEQGTAPADRVSRVIEGVLRRLGGDDLTAVPRHVSIGGEREAWERLKEG